MPRLNREKIFSAPGIFIIYIVFSFISILVFSVIFSGSNVPLAVFSMRWRLLQGCIRFFELFSAISLSALVLPFALKVIPPDSFRKYSPEFVLSIKNSVLTGIAAAAIYGLICFLALPALRDVERDMIYKGRLYQLALTNARTFAERENWEEVARFIDICESVWPEGWEVEGLKIEAKIKLDEIWYARIQPVEVSAAGRGFWPDFPGQTPPNASEALDMAEQALSEERYFDAHWLATLGNRLAGPGSAEIARAVRITADAWHAISSLEPNARETEIFRLYHLKRDGYRAMINEDWIRAYYIFLELKQFTPNDPDVENFFAMSEQGCMSIAFFHDELDFALGHTYTGNIFSFPHDDGRLVMRFSTLTLFSDLAYGTDLEILAFDHNVQLAWSMEAPYVKLLPFGFRTETRIKLLSRVLDRHNKDISWEPVIQSFNNIPPSEIQLILDAGWDEFLLLSDLFQNKGNFSLRELWNAQKFTDNYGYLTQIFQAEILGMFSSQIFFQVAAIFALIAGWRYRAFKKPNISIILMIVALPVVFYGLHYLGNHIIFNTAIWAVINFGFYHSIVAFGFISVSMFVLSVLLLAAQKS